MIPLPSLNCNTRFAALLAAALSLSTPTWSQQAGDQAPALTLRAFGTLGLARSSSEHAQFARDLSQPYGVSDQWSGKIDSVLGVQANYRLHDKVEAVAQAVSRYGAEDNFKPELSWAFLKYEPDARLSVRGGRIGTDFFMGADSRLIGYSYLPVRPSPDFFFTLMLSYFDGMDVQVAKPMGEGVARAKLYVGHAREKIPVLNDILDFDGSPLVGGFVDYQQGAWMWRANYGQLRSSSELPGMGTLLSALNQYSAALHLPSAQAAADDLAMKDKFIHYYSLGMLYDEGPLQIQAMVNRIHKDFASAKSTESGMFLLGYRIGAVTPFAGYSWTNAQDKSVDTGLGRVIGPNAVDDGILRFIEASHVQQNTVTLGLRWDFQRNMALKIQADMVRGAPSSVFPYRGVDAAFDGHTSVLSIALDFIL